MFQIVQEYIHENKIIVFLENDMTIIQKRIASVRASINEEKDAVSTIPYFQLVSAFDIDIRLLVPQKLCGKRKSGKHYILGEFYRSLNIL